MKGQNILVATDLSDNSRPAAKVGARLADELDKQLEFVHVFDLSRRGAKEKIRVFRDAGAKEKARGRVARWVEEVTHRSADAVTLEVGAPDQKIRNRAQADDVACLVISMSGRGAWNKLIFGSTALKLSSRPPCVMAVVHPDHHRISTQMTLAVGTDFSATSEGAVQEAVWFARRLDSSIRLVYANALPSTTVIHEGELPPGMETTEVIEWARDNMDSFVDRHRQLFEGLDVQSKIVADHPVAGLRSFVEERGVDWIFLGHRRPEQRGGSSTVKGKWVQQMNCSTFLVPHSTPAEDS